MMLTTLQENCEKIVEIATNKQTDILEHYRSTSNVEDLLKLRTTLEVIKLAKEVRRMP